MVWCGSAAVRLAFFVDRSELKCFNIFVVNTHMADLLFLLIQTISLYRFQFEKEHLSIWWIKPHHSAFILSGLCCLRRITWQASSITVSYRARLSTGCFNTWWDSPFYPGAIIVWKSLSENKTELLIGLFGLIMKRKTHQLAATLYGIVVMERLC